jgi:hypothetical protein
MFQSLMSVAARRPALSVRSLSLAALRLAPWIVFGPITGVMSEAAVAAFKNRRPVVGSLCVLLNVSILVAMPLLTAALLAHSGGHRA